MRKTRLRATIALSLLATFAVAGALVFPAPPAAPQVYGVAFSPRHAASLGLDWRETYAALLDDLGVRRVRLAAAWGDIERERGARDFSTLDTLLDMSADRGARVILAVGEKLPRWPECHIPAWAGDLPVAERHRAVLDIMEDVVERTRAHPALAGWQLENEPFLEFGECPERDARALLAAGEALLRRLDPQRPILVTDSGELSSWLPVSAYGDIVGTTLYRTVYDETRERYRFYDRLIPAAFYRGKARLVRLLRRKPVIISELQAEPWGPAAPTELSPEEREISMNAERFGEIVAFARRTELPVAYFWGAEYWYWLKVRQGDPSMWEAAREVFREERRP